jgi:hypothetical protein
VLGQGFSRESVQVPAVFHLIMRLV